MTKNNKTRNTEIDLIRGIAVLLMIIYHVVYDLYEIFEITFFNINDYVWLILWFFIACAFIMPAGMASALIHKKIGAKESIKKNIKRGIKLIIIGLLITIATRLYSPDQTIFFGILHFLGLSMIITAFFVQYNILNISVSIVAIIIGFIIKDISIQNPFLLIFGIKPIGFETFDYYPLFPWIGLFLLGVVIGNLIYERKQIIIVQPQGRLIKFILFIGEKSLLVYLIHQPIILAILYLLITDVSI